MNKPNQDDLTLKDRQILENAGHKALHDTIKGEVLQKNRDQLKKKLNLNGTR